MTIEVLSTVALEYIYDNIHILPSFLLQTWALIGIISFLLLFRDNREIISSKSYSLGLTLGFTSFIITSLLASELHTPAKPIILTDFIFLSGFLGGLGNALVAASFVLFGRILFAGTTNALFSFIDLFTIALCSSLLRYYFTKTNKDYMSLRSGFSLILWRLAIVELPMIIFYFAVPAIREISITLMIRRLVAGFSFSAFIVFAVILILRREHARVKQLYYEVLSGMPNRRALKNDIEEIYSAEPKKNRSLLLIDINNFRDLLQELGHDWVDVFFQRLGKELSGLANERWLARYTPSVYCFSDRSFVLILHGIRMHQIEHKGIARSIYNTMLQNTYGQSGNIKPWLTIGVFDLLASHTRKPRRFLRTLTLVERSREGTVHYFEPNIMGQIQNETDIRQLIEEWIDSKRVPLWLQPKVLLKDGCCTGAEALLRARKRSHSSRYLSPPEVFSIAATHRMLRELEWATVETIVSYLENMPEELNKTPLSLNLSPSTLSQPGFGERICALLAEKKIDGYRLVVEVIETSRLPLDKTSVRDNFNALAASGVKLSLDDFGTGYASIALLSSLPFDELKLDYSMISNMKDPRVRSAITLSIEGGKRYNATVVAEGVENIEQQRQLLNMGVENAQGFLFAKAMEFENFIQYAMRYKRKEPPSSLDQCQ